VKVAILGAYGAVGRRLAIESARLGHRVTAAGRDPSRLATVEASAHARLGIDDAIGLRRLASEHDVLVNATGIERVELARLSTGHGAAFMDISADSDYLLQLEGIRHPARGIAAGVGLAPGLTNLLAAAAPGDGPIHIGVVGGVGENHGTAAREWIWRGAGRTVNSGGEAQRVYRTARSFDVPGLGRRTLLRAHFGEQDQLSRDLARPVSSWLALDPPWGTATLRLAGFVPAVGPKLDRLSGPLARLMPARNRWSVVIADAEQTVSWASGRREVHATAAVAALCIAPLAQSAPGIYPAHRLTTLDAISDGLVRNGVTFSGAHVEA
jgi:hypothetical protein